MIHLSKRLIVLIALLFIITVFLIAFMTFRVKSLNNSIEANDDISTIEEKIDKLSRFEIDAAKYTKRIIHPLCLACFKGNYETVKILVDKGVDINAKSRMTGNTPILYTLDGGNDPKRCEIAMYLIQHGADINDMDANGNTALKKLMWNKPDSKEALELFKYLYVNASPEYDYTAFQLAANDDVPELVDWLIKEQGFSYSDLSQEDGSYLHYYYRLLENGRLWRKPLMVEYIINAKLEDINSQDSKGRTILSVAAESNEADDCAKFISLGADPFVKDNSGKTAFDYAVENNSEESKTILKEYSEQSYK